jgi:hypothetical protein
MNRSHRCGGSSVLVAVGVGMEPAAALQVVPLVVVVVAATEHIPLPPQQEQVRTAEAEAEAMTRRSSLDSWRRWTPSTKTYGSITHRRWGPQRPRKDAGASERRNLPLMCITGCSLRVRGSRVRSGGRVSALRLACGFFFRWQHSKQQVTY